MFDSGTKIYKNFAYSSMRAMVLPLLDRVEWRHHGIGVLQGYVREDVQPEVRIHVWSKRLLKPGMDASGDIHDHRFDMISHVLLGTVLHESLIATEDPNGDHEMMSLTHARAAADTDYHGPTTPLTGRYSVDRQLFEIHEGCSYTFPAKKFHRSPFPLNGGPNDVVVTCIEKHNQQDAPARLLYPVANQPVMAFGHKPDAGVVQEILEIAKDRLRR